MQFCSYFIVKKCSRHLSYFRRKTSALLRLLYSKSASVMPRSLYPENRIQAAVVWKRALVWPFHSKKCSRRIQVFFFVFCGKRKMLKKHATKCLGPFIRKIENEVCKVQRLAQKLCLHCFLLLFFGSNKQYKMPGSLYPESIK